jgi:hypothetical protein
METIRKPYEFLIRYDNQGNLQGAHVQFQYLVMDGNVQVATSIGVAEKVAVLEGDNTGFDLADIVGQAMVDLQVALDAKIDELAAAQAEIAALQAQLEALQG